MFGYSLQVKINTCLVGEDPLHFKFSQFLPLLKF